MPALYLLMLLVLPAFALGQTQTKSRVNLSKAPLQSRSLSNVLHLYQQQINIVFSHALVKKEWIIWQDPPQDDALARLRTLLDSFALKLEYDLPSKTYYVVKDDINNMQILLDIDINQALDCTPLVWANQQQRPYQRFRSDQIRVFVPLGIDEISVSCNGADNLTLSNPQDGERYTLSFNPLAFQAEEIVVTGTQFIIHKQRSQNSKTFNRVEMNKTPLRGGDPVQVINTIASMATSGVSAKPFIQGGESNELLILIDGVELVDPFHLKDFYSLYSGINPSTIDQIDFYKGIYPARLGGKMSGVMEIKTASKVDDYRYAIGFDAFTSSFKASGDAQNESLYWSIHGRRGNISDILDETNPELGSPRFSDTFAKVHWEMDDNNTFALGGLTLYDNIRLQRNEPEYSEQALSQYENNYAWLSWTHETDNNTSHKVSLSSADIKNKRSGTLSSDDAFSGSTGFLEDDKNYDLSRLKYETVYPKNAEQTLNLGINIDYAHSDYSYVASAELGSIATVLGNSNTLDQNKTRAIDSINGSAYISLSQKINEHLDVEFGLRHDWQNSDLLNSDQLSPRLRTALKIGPTSIVEISYGRYHQHPDITDLSLDDKLPLSYTTQKSDHLSINWQQTMTPNLSYSIGTYFKYIYNPKPRAESLLSQFHFLPELSADRFVLSPEYSQLRGLELSIKYQKDKLLAQVNYAYGVHKDYANNRSFYRRWDQTHTVNMQLSWSEKSLELVSQLHWHSGWHYTDINTGMLVNPFDVNQQYNQQSLPNYFSLDLAAIYVQKLKNSALRWSAHITNSTNYNNIGSYSYSHSSTDVEHLNKSPEFLLPAIPSLGVEWSF